MADLNQFIFPINDFKVEISAYTFDPYAYYLNIDIDNVNYTHPSQNSSTLGALPPPPPVQKRAHKRTSRLWDHFDEEVYEENGV
jgi:hypothetical protein